MKRGDNLISLYLSKETDFGHNGEVILSDCKSAPITEKINGQYELELEYPLDKRGKWQYLLEGNIIKADGQLFRIYHKVKNLNSIKINARHIFYDLLDNLLEDVRPTGTTGYGALEWILTHTQYSHPFISVGDVGGNDTRYFVRKNVVEAIMGSDGIINNWGGELVRDNFTIKLLVARGLDRGVLVAYGKNIQGIEETLDIDGICTRLMPIGKDGLLLSEKYIESPYINNFPHPKIKVVELNDCETEETLRAAAISYMANNKIDIPQFNYKIDFIELSKTEEYKNYAVLERVYLGDTVTIKHSKLNINLKAKVIKITKNVLTNRIEKIELGSFKPNIATSINNSIQEVKKDIVQVTSSYQKAIDDATTQINSALGGYVIKKNGELLIMDTEDPLTAVKVWRWNQNGLGYSGTGYNGPFGTAITADGHIVADFIDTGLLNASIIKAGILTGFTVQTATDGARVALNGTNLSTYNSVNQKTSQLDGDELSFYSQGELAGSIRGDSNAVQINLADSSKGFIVATDGAINLAYNTGTWSFLGKIFSNETITAIGKIRVGGIIGYDYDWKLDIGPYGASIQTIATDRLRIHSSQDTYINMQGSTFQFVIGGVVKYTIDSTGGHN